MRVNWLKSGSEPSLDEILSDPITQALMHSDVQNLTTCLMRLLSTVDARPYAYARHRIPQAA
jgi:hypothetical protein